MRAPLEHALGALGDWLELVRLHEQRRREVLGAHRKARRAQSAVVLTAVLCAALAAVFVALARGA